MFSKLIDNNLTYMYKYYFKHFKKESFIYNMDMINYHTIITEHTSSSN